MTERALQTSIQLCAALSGDDENVKGSALTKIADLPLTEYGVAVRVQIVKQAGHTSILKALRSDDTAVACKAANTLGALMAAPEAAALLIGDCGDRLLPKLLELVFSENVYAQADANFALSWAIDHESTHVYFSAEVLARIGELFVRAVDSRNFSERYRNLRTFSLVLLNKASLQTPGPFVDAATDMLLKTLLAVLMDEEYQADLMVLSLRTLGFLSLQKTGAAKLNAVQAGPNIASFRHMVESKTESKQCKGRSSAIDYDELVQCSKGIEAILNGTG